MARTPRAAKPVELPEDEDLPVRANPELLGHEAAAARLEAAARSGRLPHAWLLAGPPGIGKATLAYRFARWLLAGMAEAPAMPRPPGVAPLFLDPAHPVFRRVAAGGHPDFFALRPGTGEKAVKRVIRVEDARAVIHFLALTAAEGGWRVVLVDSAELLQPQAANALLKTIEEPPPRTVLLLTSAAPERLLPTIRSRVRRLDLRPLSEAAMQRLLATRLPGMAEAQLAALARLAEGSVGQALALAEADGLALQALVEEALAPAERTRWHALADAVTARRDGRDFATFVALLRRAISAAVRQAARGGAAPGWVAARPLADWSTLWDSLGRLAAETDALNLDRRQAVLTALAWLSPSRR